MLQAKPQSGDEVSSRGPASLSPQGLYDLAFKDERWQGSICPPVRSNLHHMLAVVMGPESVQVPIETNVSHCILYHRDNKKRAMILSNQTRLKLIQRYPHYVLSMRNP